MPPIKSVVTATLKTQFVNIPRISNSASYRSWLHDLLDVPHNKKVFANTEKPVVDGLFQAQAAKQFTSDNNKLKQAMADLASKNSKEFFEKVQFGYQNHFKASGRRNDASSHDLSIPWFVSEPGLQNRDVWSVQSYEKFAQRLERQNPNTVLTKDMVDTAFRRAVSRSSSAKLSQKGRERAVSRCLGKESTKYWKGR